MSEVWVWLGAVGGLGIGLGLGAWSLRRGRMQRAQQRARATEFHRDNPVSQVATTGFLPSSLGNTPSSLGNTPSRFPAGADTPQQRLLEHLRQTNLDLSAQLRTSASQHAKLLREKTEEVAALKEDYDQRVEELRQAHSAELKHLMTLLVEQVDGIHKSHANHVKALEAEIDRARNLRGAHGGEAVTSFAQTEAMQTIQSPRPH